MRWAEGRRQPDGSLVTRAYVWVRVSQAKICAIPVLAFVPARSAVLSNTTRRPSLLRPGFVLGPRPAVIGARSSPSTPPYQIWATPVSAPVRGLLLDSNRMR